MTTAQKALLTRAVNIANNRGGVVTRRDLKDGSKDANLLWDAAWEYVDAYTGDDARVLAFQDHARQTGVLPASMAARAVNTLVRERAR